MLRITSKNKDKFISILYVLYLLWELSPYFTWSTFQDGKFGYLFGIPLQYFFALIVIVLYFLDNFNIGIKKNELRLVGGVLLLGVIHTTICGLNFTNFISSVWIRYIMISMYILFPVNIKEQIFNIYKVTFAVTLIPAILYSVLNLMSISIPHGSIESMEAIKSNNYYTYNHYPFAVQLYNSVRIDPISPYRLCGIYNEPGVVGTMCALLLTADSYRIKNKWQNIILLIGGILSFSLAFYLMMGIYFVLANIGKHKFKNALALGIVIIAVAIFMNVNFSNPALKSLQARVQISQEGLIGDNRTNDRFDYVFSEVAENPIALFIGFGMGAIGTIQRERLIDGSSYKCLIYDYGYIGLALFLLWLFVVVKEYKGKKWSYGVLILLVIYILNIYQRPTMFYPAYLVVLLGGCFNINKEVFENTKVNDRHGTLFKIRSRR